MLHAAEFRENGQVIFDIELFNAMIYFWAFCNIQSGICLEMGYAPIGPHWQFQ